MKEFTSNGIEYTWELAGPGGASFILFPEPHHTKDDIQKAKEYLRHSQDVVSLSVADDWDRDNYFKREYFRDPRTRPLKWYQIEQDEKLIRKCRKAGMTPEEFVTEHVLPFTEQVKDRNIKKFGTKILQDE